MSRYDKEYFGIKVTFQDGGHDHYDPCEEEPTIDEEGITTIRNIRQEYKISEPITWEKYRLCSECRYEVEEDGWCRSDCPLTTYED